MSIYVRINVMRMSGQLFWGINERYLDTATEKHRGQFKVLKIIFMDEAFL